MKGVTMTGCRVAPLLSLLIACDQHSDSEPVHTYRHAAGDFSVSVPSGWTMQDSAYAVLDGMFVFSIARNRVAGGVTPALRDWRPGDWQAALVEQVPPGGIVVLFQIFQIGPKPSCSFSRDTIGDSLYRMIDSLHTIRGSSSVTNVSFQKRGNPWVITTIARDAAAKDLRMVDALLRTVIFDRTPVTRSGHAAQLAYIRLPDDIRRGTDGAASFNVAATDADSTFTVRFTRCPACDVPEERSKEEWVFRVSRAGTVETIE